MLSELQAFFESLSPELRSDNTYARDLIAHAQSELAESSDSSFNPQLAASVADWLKDYLRSACAFLVLIPCANVCTVFD